MWPLYLARMKSLGLCPLVSLLPDLDDVKDAGVEYRAFVRSGGLPLYPVVLFSA